MNPDASQLTPIRKATAGDLGVVTDLRLAFLADVRGVVPESFPATFAEQTHAFVRQACADGSLHSWLAMSASDAVGVVSVLVQHVPPRPEEPRVREGYIINLYLDPSYRGHGVGRALLEACIAGAHRLGIRRFHLHATDDARPLYEGPMITEAPAEVCLLSAWRPASARARN